MMSPSDISTCRLLFHRSQDMSPSDYLPVDCYSIGVRIMSPSDISTCRLLFHRSQDDVS